MVQIAQVLKSNGSDGDLLIGLRIDPEDLDIEEPVFIYDDGLPVPFFVTRMQRRGNTRAVVHLMGIDSLKDAEELCQRQVWGDEDIYADEEDELPDLEGFILLDEDGTEVGEVTGLEPIPANPCLYVRTKGGGEVLVPLHEDLLLDLDEESGTVRMNIPPGLLYI